MTAGNKPPFELPWAHIKTPYLSKTIKSPSYAQSPKWTLCSRIVYEILLSVLRPTPTRILR